VLRTESMLESVASFLQTCVEWEITVLDLPTAYWHELAEKMVAGGLTTHGGLRLVIIGGERAVPERWAQWRKAVGDHVRLLNTYGPTETTVVATTWESSGAAAADQSAREVPIGRPIANVRTYVLDRHSNAVPIGVPGELHIGGVGLDRGYLNHPDLTAETFIPDLFGNEPGGRLYKTGDLVRYLPGGNMEFLGRIDQQVKIRGFRVEPGEIETVLSQHPAVNEAVVVAREDAPGDRRLMAYAVLKSGQSLEATEARSFLKAKLPEYMVPSAFVFLDSLPVTQNGKIDRNALLATRPTLPKKEEAFTAARDELELQLAQVWERILRTRPIGLKDNFFDLGGHSLLAVRLISQVEKVTGRRLSLATLFQAPTIEEQAKLVRSEGWSSPWSSLVAIQPGGSKPPLFCVHAHDGNVLFWRDLSRRLGLDQPFYGLQAHGLDGKQAPDTRVEDLASRYVKEIRLLQPEGPYFLGGHCFGGLVAFEMAQQLHAQGQTVALLALMDSFAPLGGQTIRRRVPLRQRIQRVLELITLHIDNLMLLGQREKLAYVEIKASRLLYKIYMSVGASWVPAAQTRRRILEAGSKALRNYQPKVYPGPITLFRAAEMPPGLRAKPQDRWAKLAAGGLEVHVIPGYFAQTVYEPRVRVLAEKLTACLDSAQADALPCEVEFARAVSRS
jgi:aspartate racemase